MSRLYRTGKKVYIMGDKVGFWSIPTILFEIVTLFILPFYFIFVLFMETLDGIIFWRK